MPPEETSETQAGVQDTGAEQSLPLDSEAQAAAQEQPGAEQTQEPSTGKPAKSTQELDPEERIRREVQSRADRIRHETEMRYQQQMQQQYAQWQQQQEMQAQQAALESMSPEEYGEYRRQQDAAALQYQQWQQSYLQPYAEQMAQQRLQEQSTYIINQALEAVPAPVRKRLQEMMGQGKFQSLGDFLATAQREAIAHESGRLATQQTNVAREAARKNATAELAETVAPVVSSGQPAGRLSKLSHDELLSQGWDEEIAAMRKRGR